MPHSHAASSGGGGGGGNRSGGGLTRSRTGGMTGAASSPSLSPHPHPHAHPSAHAHGHGHSSHLTSSSLALAAASSSLAGAAFSSKLIGVALVASADFGTRCLFRYPVPPPKAAALAGGKGVAGGKSHEHGGGQRLQSSQSFGGLSDSSLPASPLLRSESGSGGVGSGGGGGGGGSGGASFLSVLNGGPTPVKEANQSDSGLDSDSEPPKSGVATRGDTGGPSSSPAGAGGSGGGGGVGSGAALEEMYGMSPDDFARLFCPKQALCAQVLDVMVDALRFVSFPVRLHYQESRSHQRRARAARQKARLAHRHKVNRQGGTRAPVPPPTTSTTTTDGHGATSQERRKQRRARKIEQQESKLKEDAESLVDPSTDPNRGSSDEKKQHSANAGSDPDADAGADAVGESDAFSPAQASEADSSSEAEEGDSGDEDDDEGEAEDEDDEAADGDACDDVESDTDADGSEHDLTFFNVVFILSGSTSQALASMYGNVAALLSRALLHEQTRANFVSKQAQLLVTIRDKYLHFVSRTQSSLQHASLQRAQSGAAGGAVGGGGAGGGNGASAVATADFHALSHLLLNHSLLANHLYQLYYGLIHQEYERFGAGGAGAGGAFAASSSLGMLGAPPPGAQQAAMGSMEDAASIGGGAGAAHAHFGHVPAQYAGNAARNSAHYTQDGVAAVAAAFHKLGMQYSTVAQQQQQHQQQQQQSSSSHTAAGVARRAAHTLLHLDHSHTQLLINNWFMLHFSLTPPFVLPTYNPHSTPPVSVPPLQPYNTILLTVPVATLLQSLPADSSPLLRTLIRHADPRHSFHALSCSLRIPLAHLYKLSLHLLYWNKCLLLDVVAMDNVYGVNPAMCQLGNNVAGGGGSRHRTAATPVAASQHSATGGPATPASARRSSSMRPSGHGNLLSAHSSSSSHSSRRRSASAEGNSSLHAAASLPFIPAPLMYEYSQRWPPSSLLAFLTRFSTRRTLGEHLQRVAFAPALYQSTAAGAHGHGHGHGFSSASSMATSSAASVAAAASLSAVQREMQNELMEQLLFLLKKQWVRQVQRYVVRIVPDDSDSNSGSDDHSGSESERGSEESRSRFYRSDSARSIRSLGRHSPRFATAAPSDASPPEDSDPWRALLDRLTPLYFNGRHSVTEILWKERDTGLTFGHLQHLCNLYPQELSIIQHM